jgi:hypothetical protein
LDLKREKVVGSWKRLHDEELLNLYASLNIIRMVKSRMMKWVGHVACMGKMKNLYRTSAGKSERKRLLGRPRNKCEDNTGMYLREIGWKVMDWIHLAQDTRDRDKQCALVDMIMNFWVPCVWDDISLLYALLFYIMGKCYSSWLLRLISVVSSTFWQDIWYVRETGREDVDCIHLAQERDQWQAFMTAMNLHIS